MTGPDPYRRLGELELAWGDVPGFEPPPRPSGGAPGSPLTALESAIRPALSRPPCLVVFSGGRDSSAVLATAVGLARRLGFDDPIPVSRRYPGSAQDESPWQEMLVRHLGLAEWVRIEGEADLLGPAATTALSTRGVLWPPLTYLWEPLFEQTAGGSLLTGEGGDEVFGPHRSRLAAALLERRRHASRSLAADTARSLLPKPLRRGQAQEPRAWLRPGAQAALERALAADEAAEPYRWTAHLARLAHRRSAVIGTHNLATLAREHGALLIQPLLDPAFLAALGACAPRLGYTDRTGAMASVFAKLLPPPLLARTDKVFFNQLVFGPTTRERAGRWDGTGVPRHLVDSEALRDAWLAPQVHAGTALLLQSAWLANHRPKVPLTTP